MEPLVSIITPLYNSEKYVAETIDSVLAQTYQNWEMIVIDDCSTDKGPEIVDEYCRIDSRIKLLKNSSNSGGAITRNNGIEFASGRFIAFLDSDDLWKPNKLEVQISFMINNIIEFSYCDYDVIDSRSIETGEKRIAPKILNYNTALPVNRIGCLTAIYDAVIIGKVYFPIIRKRQDYALWLKILKMGIEGKSVGQNLAKYRVHDNSISANKVDLIKYNWYLYKKIENLGFIRSTVYLCYVLGVGIIKKAKSE